MFSRRHQAKLVLSLLLVATLSSPGHATSLLGGGGRGGGLLNRPEILDRPLRQPSLPQLSSREAASIAESRHGGRAVGVREIQTPSGTVYRVRILKDNGKIKNVIIDER